MLIYIYLYIYIFIYIGTDCLGPLKADIPMSLWPFPFPPGLGTKVFNAPPGESSRKPTTSQSKLPCLHGSKDELEQRIGQSSAIEEGQLRGVEP